MGFLETLRHREARTEKPVEAAEAVCPHVTLIPRWESVDDLGKPGRVTLYTCESCDRSFSREEGERIKATVKERLRSSDVEPRQYGLKKSA